MLNLSQYFGESSIGKGNSLAKKILAFIQGRHNNFQDNNSYKFMMEISILGGIKLDLD